MPAKTRRRLPLQRETFIMNESIAVSADLVRETGRMDARYHILLAKYREVVDELMINFTTIELVDLAKRLPHNQQAMEALLPPRLPIYMRSSLEQWMSRVVKAEGIDTLAAKQRKLAVAVYCAAASDRAVSIILTEMLRLSEQRLRLVDGLNNLLKEVAEKKCAKLNALMKGKDDGQSDAAGATGS